MHDSNYMKPNLPSPTGLGRRRVSKDKKKTKSPTDSNILQIPLLGLDAYILWLKGDFTRAK